MTPAHSTPDDLRYSEAEVSDLLNRAETTSLAEIEGARAVLLELLQPDLLVRLGEHLIAIGRARGAAGSR